jgi:maltose alpha-D-glucosyltransferase/alpha-amylase
MAYHFPLMPRMFMAVALEDRYPIAEILRQTPEIPENCQWAIFLRNHDELTLEMVTDRERDYMYKMYAQEPRMRVNVGIRRRLAALLTNDVDRVKLMNALLLSMPGSPILYYGDEIGMGDNIFLGDRNGVRTPMQWSIDRNAGFSRADPQRLYLPVIMDPIYGYQAVNVEAQSRDPSSLLNWTKRLLAVRRQHQCFGRGALDFVRPRNRKVLAYVRTHGDEIVLCVANLSHTAQSAELDLSAYKGRVPVELMGRNAFPPIGDLPYFLTLPAHAFFWLLLSDRASPPEWHIERMPATELPVLVMPSGLATLLPEAPMRESGDRVARRTLKQLEEEVLPEFLRHRRWFSAGARVSGVRLGKRTLWVSDGSRWLISLVDVSLPEGERQQYILPLCLAWEDGPDGGVLRSAEWTLAKVRESAHSGVLVDAFADPAFCLAVARAVERKVRVPFGDGEARFTPTNAFEALARNGIEPVQYLGREQTNTSVILGEGLFLKTYRRAQSGINPDMELPRYLMQAGFGFIAPLAGTVEYVRTDSAPVILAALFAYVPNQGDLWSYALNHLQRFAGTLSSPGDARETAPHSLFLTQMQTFGRRVGGMHAVLAADTPDPDFKPAPISETDLAEWATTMQDNLQRTLALVQQRVASLPEVTQPAAHSLIAAAERVAASIRELSARPVDALKTRYHGDLDLSQVLLTADDFLITDFEGDATRPIEERRQKGSPLRDVASILRSLDYARAVALDRSVSLRPDLEERLAPAFTGWYRQASKAFLEGYRVGIGEARSWPSAPADAPRLIRLFQIERALRELRAALDQQPRWSRVPIEALLALTA